MLIILGLMVVASVLASVMQVGFLFVPERIAPDFSRIDPLQGWRRLVSLTSAVRLAFGIVKVLVIATVTGYCLRKQWPEILAIGAHETAEIAAFVVEITLWTALKIALALLVLAVLDYAYHWWKQEQDLRMTHQEMREELKDFQGDPQIVARRRAVQRQLVLHRLADTVPKADVVITNPTELAIAIQYTPEEMAAPIVLAKGAGSIADRIRRLALEHNIPIVEKKPLAQALYREVDINQAIPDRMYAAVAEVLAYVYQLKGKTLPKAAAIR
jgi:flagellar biosynthetic protein FlhB